MLAKKVQRAWTCITCRFKNPKGSSRKSCAQCHIRKTTTRSGLKAKCDKLARELCRDLANGLCARCGGPGSDWAHRMPRRHHSMRWDMDNCDYLCRPCHQFFTDHPTSFVIWVEKRVGSLRMMVIEQRANETWDRDYSKVLTYLRETREKMETK